ncbi:efflux RND transporter periplasmic adaptor subunit [Caldisericum exile]|uniref:HlyD family secretion protein n=1 Tax=Caldisericum exile (strain DSM 21853 / NBRC 104410 / AZM16c01) TaxID=511051 RepID=A0A7U6GG14_CALEA|nr:efflux RND transporter periplasmic adaptor subunit [Caldisericum exile]BAL81704.1 HlyD family secretion protein [Caldisericum exile AZM16c01]
MKKKLLVLGVVLALVVLSVGCASVSDSAKISSNPRTFTVSYMDLNSEVNLTGTVSYIDEENVYPKISGIVKNIFVSEGSLVKANDKILEIDSTQANLSYQNANASYQNAKISYELTLRSKADLENSVKQAENNLKSAEASYDVAKANYDSVFGSDKSTDQQRKQAKQQLVQAEVTLNNARILLDNAKRQLDNFTLKLEQVKIQLDQAEASFDVAKKSLNDYIIRSPIDGVVLTLNVSLNAPIQVGVPVAVVGNPRGFLITAYADEIDMPKLKVGQNVTVTFDALPGTALKGRVSFIGLKKVNIQGGSAYVVKIQVDESNPTVKSGMSANALIVTSSKKHVLAVPVSSIVTLADGRAFVDKVINGKVQRIEVKTGISSNAYVEIVSGLSAGDTVLLIPNTGSTTSNSPFGG